MQNEICRFRTVRSLFTDPQADVIIVRSKHKRYSAVQRGPAKPLAIECWANTWRKVGRLEAESYLLVVLFDLYSRAFQHLM